MTGKLGENGTLDLFNSLEREEIDGIRDSTGHRNKESNRLHQAARPFIAWDGEGITYPSSRQQAYILLAASTGDYIVAGDGNSLSTEQCLTLLFDVERKFPNAYHVGFGFSYDVNQIINSMSRRNLWGLSEATKRGKTFSWEGYRFKIHPGKMFRVSKGDKISDNFQCITIYDTFGFFQKSFLSVVKSYFPDELSSIESGKNSRGTFKYSGIDEIIRYCLAENNLLVKIMERLRNNFEDRELYLRDWHGPGAVASASLKKHHIKEAIGEVPKEVSRASQLAYQGGRFELLRAGYYNQNIYQYDINSAYPSAIVNLPNLSAGCWEHVDRFQPKTFGVWNVEYADKRTDRQDRYARYRAQPLFYRDSYGRIAYTPRASGWYWTPEAELIAELRYPANAEIIEGWIFRPTSTNRPFAHIEDIYQSRLEKKRKGDGAERVDKLEMNSYYGKFAQRSGWFQKGDRIPSYHQLEWAGYTTSATRAKLYRAYLQNVGAVFAFETDAIFSTEKLELNIGTGLGEWSITEYPNILYIQSGFYFTNSELNSGSDSDSVSRYRGFDKGSLSFDMVMEWLDKLNPQQTFAQNQPKLYGTSKRFIGFKRGLMSRNPQYWRSWDETPRAITIGRDGKRVHMPGCPLCIGKGLKWTEGLHGLTTVIPGGPSQPHKIPWNEERYIENQWGEEEKIEACDGWEC